VTHVNGLTNDFHTTAYTPDENCESHWVYGDITELPDRKASTTSVLEFLRIAREQLGSDAIIELDQEIVTQLECHSCETITDVYKPISQVSYNDGVCPGCGQVREVHMLHTVTGDEPFGHRSLSAIGIPPLHIVRVRNDKEYRFLELTGDLADTLHWSHFEGGARSAYANRVRVHPRPQIKLGETIAETTPPETLLRPRVVVH
jgi:hypothetical protein